MSALTAHIPDSRLDIPPIAYDCRIGRCFLKLAFVLCFAATLSPQSKAQMAPIQNNGRASQTSPTPIPDPMGSNSIFQARRIRELNVERQSEMVSDADRLLKLTAQLNAEVAHSHSSTLTPDQLHMLERIEKLAKSVRDKMSNPIQGTIFEDSFPPL